MYFLFWELLKLASTFSKLKKIYKKTCLWTQCVVNSINYSIDCIFMKDNLYPKEILEFFCTNFLYRRQWCSIFLNNLLGFFVRFVYVLIWNYCKNVLYLLLDSPCDCEWTCKVLFQTSVEIILVWFPKKKNYLVPICESCRGRGFLYKKYRKQKNSSCRR